MASAMVMRNALRRSAHTISCRSALRPAIAAQCLRPAGPSSKRSFSITSAALAKKYTTAHEWIELADDGETATIGISTYAAAALGDVVYIELPAADLEFGVGDTIGAVESVKSASDILAPVSGTILETNEALGDKPGEINKSPEGEAWLAKIKVADKGELDELMDEAAYGAFTEAEGGDH